MKKWARLIHVVGVFLMMFFIATFALADGVPEQTRKFNITPQEHYDHVMKEVLIDIAVIGIIFSAITLYFIVAYRRRAADDMGKQPKLSAQAILGWLIIPTALFMADDYYLFVKGWDLHDHMRKVPNNAYEIKVTGQMWSWSYDYPNGASTINELVVPVNKPILLKLASLDVIHSHYLQKYRVTEDAVPGRNNYEWFLPTEEGESIVTCREYCGTLHSGMYGTVKVVSQSEFDTWLEANAPKVELQNLPATQQTADMGWDTSQKNLKFDMTTQTN